MGGQNIQDSLNHHNFSHSGNDLNTAKVVGLLGQVPAYFIEQLMKPKGPDGQALINTTVFVRVTDMGDGNHGLVGALLSGIKNGWFFCQRLLAAVPIKPLWNPLLTVWGYRG